jgi:Cu+-exporting ATPase
MLLNENNLCGYYNLDKNPGIKVKGKFISKKFAYLDNEDVLQKMAQFISDQQVNITFQLPQMHCASCIFLLENLHKIQEGIISSQVNFQKKEVLIKYDPSRFSLRKLVELLAFVGYEPSISLEDTVKKKHTPFKRRQLYKIGVAGFCFSNIMMLSFPEYFSSGYIEQAGLKQTFTWLNFALSLPVLFYSASGFFSAAWKGMLQRDLNIDAPIALAILVTYIRSYFEIISGQGVGYLDSGTGIVFFMLVGRWFQNKTYDSLVFDRDYRSYFPLGITVLNEKEEKNIPLTQLNKGDRIILRNEEMVPADAILMKGYANIDYSFVSGENVPVKTVPGQLIYAGGKQMGNAIELEVVNEVSQSYITQLWNNDVFSHKKNIEKSYIHPWSRYFTLVLFAIALIAVAFWWNYDPSKILPSLTSILIVACPCSLLLTATFTYGNMLRIFGKNRFFLKNTTVIESLAKMDTIVFDKTGTLTRIQTSDVGFSDGNLNENDKLLIKAVASQSSHPLSKLIRQWININETADMPVVRFKEYAGAGIEASINEKRIRIGNAAFVNQNDFTYAAADTSTHTYIRIDNRLIGQFSFANNYRKDLGRTVNLLKDENYKIHLLSGDNSSEKNNLQDLLGPEVPMFFHQTPQEKLEYIRGLQQAGNKVLMVGDGLNDAGALMQSDVGVAVSDNTARFSPACDAILDGNSVNKLNSFLRFAKSGKKIITAVFILSILYNIIGLSFAVQAKLAPVVAAILMPVSTISIVLLTTFLCYFSARKRAL